MLKIFFWLLLSANVVLLGFNSGYLGAKAHESHEPERLKAQLHIEKLQLLTSSVDLERALPEHIDIPVTDAPVPVVAPLAAQAPVVQEAPAQSDPVCLEFAYFNTPDAQKFDNALASLALKTKPMQRNVEEIISYMVHIPTTDERSGADRKAAELRRQGVTDFYVIPGTYAVAALRWNISLGVFKTEKAAKSFVTELTGQGIKGLRITARKSGSTRLVYQLREVDPQTRVQLVRIMQNFSAQKMRQCE